MSYDGWEIVAALGAGGQGKVFKVRSPEAAKRRTETLNSLWAIGQCAALCDLGQSVGTLTGVDPCEAVEHTAGPAPEREALNVGDRD